MPRGENGNHHCSGGEAKITCKKPKCHTKITIKLGSKGNGSIRTVNCKKCGTLNSFWVDTEGKVHTPPNRSSNRNHFNPNAASY